jgi:putative hydrolase of the HAD superfamily
MPPESLHGGVILMLVNDRRKRGSLRMIRYIWFDLGLTLVGNNHAAIYQKVLADLGVKKEINEVECAYHLANKYFMREHPGCLGKKEGVRGYLEKLMEYLQLGRETQRFLIGMEQENPSVCWRKFPFTDGVLNRLHQRGIKTGLISNWDHSCRRVLEENGLLSLMDTVVISSEAGYEKPDRRIFERALLLAGVEPSVCLYVGDNYYDDAVGASAVGMRTLLINPPGCLGIEELKFPDVIESIQDVERYTYD